MQGVESVLQSVAITSFGQPKRELYSGCTQLFGYSQWLIFKNIRSETDETGSALVALFGAVSEVGSVLATYKKKEREHLQDKQFKAILSEEIGDTLWYLANLARLNGLDLNTIAEANLEKAHSLFDPGLQQFICGETGKTPGKLVCHSMHAFVSNQRDARRLAQV